ncbi:IS5 family transposase [Chroococcidiopsis sp. SAG 2025]|uniref:IS5 family transposase n=1 Tax=Chroococcidiopsis sp. SAG 2025 TaxID=171389 RepID=UPI002936F7EA|nr:IS5 family transposase [Chroococcidiopsis sp. SAG 2025]
MSRKAYKSDLTDREWQIIEPLIPPVRPGGHPRTVDMREVVNAIFYLLKTGCAWEMLPHDFPPYSTVYYYFRRWQKRGIWQQINLALREQVRMKLGKSHQATAAIVDSQSVKTTRKKGEVSGFDGGKLVKGRKRHVVVDPQGLLMGVVITEANASERLGAIVALLEECYNSKSLELIWADSGYSGENFAQAVMVVCGAEVEIVKRITDGFEVLPRRWVVERTFGWLGRYRRLSKDYELLPEISESMVYVAMVRLMLRRLAA